MLRKACDLRRKTVLLSYLLLLSVVSIIFQRRHGLAGIQKTTATYSTVAWANRTAWPPSSIPCGHRIDENEEPINNGHYRKVERSRKFTVESDYINGHWAELLSAAPVANGKLVHVHHVCVKGGDKGLVVPHLGGLLKAIGYMDRRYFPESVYPTAFREFTFEELLGLFGTTAEKGKHKVEHINATLVRRLYALKRFLCKELGPIYAYPPF